MKITITIGTWIKPRKIKKVAREIIKIAKEITK